MDLESRELLLDLIEVLDFKRDSYLLEGMGTPAAVYHDVARRLEEVLMIQRTRKPIPKAIFLAPDEQKRFAQRGH